MNESDTRLHKIDPKLKAAGWGTVEGSRITTEYTFTKGKISQTMKSKPKRADYLLIYKGVKLAVVEAKSNDIYEMDRQTYEERFVTDLQKTGTRPRILFLADRNVLANQAMIDFGGFKKDAMVRIKPESIAKDGQVPTNGSIFFTIFQTFMCGPTRNMHSRTGTVNPSVRSAAIIPARVPADQVNPIHEFINSIMFWGADGRPVNEYIAYATTPIERRERAEQLRTTCRA